MIYLDGFLYENRESQAKMGFEPTNPNQQWNKLTNEDNVPGIRRMMNSTLSTWIPKERNQTKAKQNKTRSNFIYKALYVLIFVNILCSIIPKLQMKKLGLRASPGASLYKLESRPKPPSQNQKPLGNT